MQNLSGNPDIEIRGLGKIETATADQITFISNPLYAKHFLIQQCRCRYCFKRF